MVVVVTLVLVKVRVTAETPTACSVTKVVTMTVVTVAVVAAVFGDGVHVHVARGGPRRLQATAQTPPQLLAEAGPAQAVEVEVDAAVGVHEDVDDGPGQAQAARAPRVIVVLDVMFDDVVDADGGGGEEEDDAEHDQGHSHGRRPPAPPDQVVGPHRGVQVAGRACRPRHLAQDEAVADEQQREWEERGQGQVHPGPHRVKEVQVVLRGGAHHHPAPVPSPLRPTTHLHRHQVHAVQQVRVDQQRHRDDSDDDDGGLGARAEDGDAVGAPDGEEPLERHDAEQPGRHDDQGVHQPRVDLARRRRQRPHVHVEDVLHPAAQQPRVQQAGVGHGQRRQVDGHGRALHGHTAQDDHGHHVAEGAEDEEQGGTVAPHRQRRAVLRRRLHAEPRQGLGREGVGTRREVNGWG